MIESVVVLFTRIDANHVAGNDLRRAILDAVRDRPGIRVAELARAHQVDPKTIVHHVRVLERAGRMEIVDAGRARLMFAPGTARIRVPPPRALLALRAVAEGAVTPAKLGRALEIPRGTALGLLRAMEAQGLACRSGPKWGIAPAAAELMARYDQSLSPKPGIGAS